jgi:hypothetical protein
LISGVPVHFFFELNGPPTVPLFLPFTFFFFLSTVCTEIL